MIVPMHQMMRIAYGNYAIGAFNINNLEQAVGLFNGNAISKAPFIVQISKGAREYTNKEFLEAMIRTADRLWPEAIFAVHLDHGDEATCMDCIESGFYSSVMIDGSALDFDANVALTRRIVAAAHARGVSVEAELGKLGGVEEHVKVAEADSKLTDPKKAKTFVQETGCDCLACAIGTSHGAYKFTGTQGLHFEILEEIHELLPGFPIVMHGSSSVPEDEVRRINYFGGKLLGAKGVDARQFKRAAKLGVCKINIDSDGRLVWCRVHREQFALYPENFDLRPPGKVFMDSYARFIADKNVLLGSAGQLELMRTILRDQARG